MVTKQQCEIDRLSALIRDLLGDMEAIDRSDTAAGRDFTRNPEYAAKEERIGGLKAAVASLRRETGDTR